MKKRIIILLVLSILIVTKNVYAKSYRLTLNSETKEVDTRVVILKVYDVDKRINGLLFDLDAVSAFEWFIPEKEYTHVIEKRRLCYEGTV